MNAFVFSAFRASQLVDNWMLQPLFQRVHCSLGRFHWLSLEQNNFVETCMASGNVSFGEQRTLDTLFALAICYQVASGWVE